MYKSGDEAVTIWRARLCTKSRSQVHSPPHEEGNNILEKSGDAGEVEIGRILHLKSEIRNRKLDGSNWKFRISDLRCRTRPIFNFSSVFGVGLVKYIDAHEEGIIAQDLTFL